MKLLKFSLIGLISALIGFVCGLLGGGGGMICVPFLLYAFSLKDKQAHASAIFVILLSSLASSVLYIVNGYIDFQINLFVGIGVLLGGILGAILLRKISNKYLDFIFCVIMLLAGLKLLF